MMCAEVTLCGPAFFLSEDFQLDSVVDWEQQPRAKASEK